MVFSDAPSLSFMPSCKRTTHTHTITHTLLLLRGKPGHSMKDHPPPPMVQWRQSDGWDGEKWERDKTTILSLGGRSKRGEEGSRTERESGGQTGSGLHIWQVKLAVINPAEWPYLFSVVCECGPVRLKGNRSVQLQGRQRNVYLGQEAFRVHIRGCGWT